MTQNTIRKIQSLYARLSEKEKKIADYIIDNPKNIIHATISEVAENLEMADATVFRFCKRIGFNGFQDLKIALATETVTPIQQIHEEISEHDDALSITQKIFKSNIQTLENTLQIMDPTAMKEAVKLLSNARQIYFFGTGGSAVIAMDAYHKFLRTGIPSFAFIDSHFQLMSASQLSEADIAVIISHSGTNRDTINILKTVQENGAKSIAITAFPKSTVAQKSDIVLFTTSEETEFRSEALSSRIAQLGIIDALYVNMMVLHKDKGKHALEKMRKSIAQTRI